MNELERGEAPFSGRVWQEIDRAVQAVREANCTVRRFLEVDGPYGMGLTSVSGDEQILSPSVSGPKSVDWNVTPWSEGSWRELPVGVGAGTYLVSNPTRPVPMIVSDFYLGMRAIEAFEFGCQPRTSRRHPGGPGRGVGGRAAALLRLRPRPGSGLPVICEGSRTGACSNGVTGGWRSLRGGLDHLFGTGQGLAGRAPDPAHPAPVNPNRSGRLSDAVISLSKRGYAGPFALVAGPKLYVALYQPTGDSVLNVDLLRSLFRGGIYLAPVINEGDAHDRLGAVITTGRAYSRLVVGQDWVTTYRGRDGLMHRFMIMSSLQLRICDRRSIQVLIGPPS